MDDPKNNGLAADHVPPPTETTSLLLHFPQSSAACLPETTAREVEEGPTTAADGHNDDDDDDNDDNDDDDDQQQQHHQSQLSTFFETVLHRAEVVVEDLLTFEELDMAAIDTAMEEEDIDILNELVPTFQDLTAPDFIQRTLSSGGGAVDHTDHPEEQEEMTTTSTTNNARWLETVEHMVHPEDPFLPHGGAGGGGDKLGFLPLVVLIFYNVSGGPFGVESSVRSAGPMFTLLGFIIAPLCWSVQEAAMTAELATAFPEASGGVAWVETAFGANWGWLTGYLGWVAGATDNAIYPVLFLDYLLQAAVGTTTGGGAAGVGIGRFERFILLGSISILLGYVNWRGLAVVGQLSVTICFVAMSPFLLLTILGLPQIDPARWFEGPPGRNHPSDAVTDDDAGPNFDGFFHRAAWGGVLWRPFLNNLFWNLNSFDATGSFAADIDQPSTMLPKALLWSVILVVLCYLLPLLVALGATDAAPGDWTDGYLTRVATEVVGPWLGAYTVFAAGISNIAMFQAELSADAFQLMGMADRGHVPKLFSIRSVHGTPTFGIILGTAVIVVMGVSHLDQLIEMLNFNYSISLLIEYAAFLHLRFTRPDLPRPWKIPLGKWGCVLFMLPTISMTLLLLALASYTTYWFCLGVNFVGLAMFYAKTIQIDQAAHSQHNHGYGQHHHHHHGTSAAVDKTTTTTAATTTKVTSPPADQVAALLPKIE
jgi:amino acid transporter